MKIPSGRKRGDLFSSFSRLVVCLISWIPSLLFLSSPVFCAEQHQTLSSDTIDSEDLYGRDGQPQILFQVHKTRYPLSASLFLSAYLILLQHAGRAETKENTRSSTDVLLGPDDKKDQQNSPLLPSHREEFQDAKDTDQPLDQQDNFHRPPSPPSPSSLLTESSREEDEDSPSERVVHTPEPPSTSRKGRLGALPDRFIDPSALGQRPPRPPHDPENPAHSRSLYSRHTRSKTAMSTHLRAKIVKTPVGIERTTSLSSFSHVEYFHTSSPTSPSPRRRESPSLSPVVGVEDARRRHNNNLLGAETPQDSSSAGDSPTPTRGHPSSSAPTHSPPFGGAADDAFVQDSRRKYRRRVTSRSRTQPFYLLEKAFTYVQQAVAILCILYGLFQLFEMWRAGTGESHLHFNVETSSSSSSTIEQTEDEKRHSDKEKANDKLKIVEKNEVQKIPSGLPRKNGSPQKTPKDVGEPKRNLRRKESPRLETREVASALIAGEKPMRRTKEEKRRVKKKEEEDRIPSFTMLS